MNPLHLLVVSLIGWLQREQHEVIEYLREENRVLKAQLRNQRVRLTDDERRHLAAAPTRNSISTSKSLSVPETRSAP